MFKEQVEELIVHEGKVMYGNIVIQLNKRCDLCSEIYKNPDAIGWWVVGEDHGHYFEVLVDDLTTLC